MEIKAVGTALFIYLFFRVYFWVMENPAQPPFVVPLTQLDAFVPFNIIGLPIYLSLWIYVSLPPALLNSLAALVRYGFWNLLMCLSCLMFFYLVPTSTPPQAIDLAQYPTMAFLRVDKGLNAFPSLHVASAVFSAIWLHVLLQKINAPRYVQIANLTYALLIIWSTMAIRQHVFLDALAGLIVGIAFAVTALRTITRRLPQTAI